MIRNTILLFSIILLPILLVAQSATWEVKAMTKQGYGLDVNVYFEDGTSVPIIAIYEDGNDHFMDVKGIRDGKEISIKLIVANDILVPVKGVTESSAILKVKAVDRNGNILDVKGVSRDGNTLNIAAINSDGKNLPLKAISPDGVERDVKGVKFTEDRVEMKIGDVQIIGHVKAMPTIDVGYVDSKWPVSCKDEDGGKMDIVAINKKGKEFPVKAKLTGEFPYLMNIRAESNVDIYIKLVKNEDGLLVIGVDEFGRLYDVQAKSSTGNSFRVIGKEQKGNVTPIFAVGDDDAMYPVKAISSKGHEFDVKGLKVKKEDVEGVIIGPNDAYVRYYAHVKALASPELAKEK